MPWVSESDADAIHDNVAGEIAAITEKTTPVDADLVVIEDSEASNAKKKIQLLNVGPRGVLGYAEITSTQSGITTTTDITGLSVTVDVAASRRIRISLQGLAESGTAGTRSSWTIVEGGANLQVVLVHHSEASADGRHSFHGATVETPSPGSHTYKIQGTGLDSASVAFFAASTVPGFILVEDIGSA